MKCTYGHKPVCERWAFGFCSNFPDDCPRGGHYTKCNGCTRENCHFYHPPGTIASVSPSSPSQSMEGAISGHGRNSREQSRNALMSPNRRCRRDVGVRNFRYSQNCSRANCSFGKNCRSAHSLIERASVEDCLLPIRGEKKFLVVGKTGNGKSSVGNTLLGCYPTLGQPEESVPFEEVPGITSGTKCVKPIKRDETLVVDTIGLADTRENYPASKVIEVFMGIVDALPDGFHSLLLVSSGRFTPEEIAVFVDLILMFGVEVLEHLIVVRTKEPRFRDDKYVLSQKTEILAELVRLVGGLLVRRVDPILANAFVDRVAALNPDQVVLVDMAESPESRRASSFALWNAIRVTGHSEYVPTNWGTFGAQMSKVFQDRENENKAFDLEKRRQEREADRLQRKADELRSQQLALERSRREQANVRFARETSEHRRSQEGARILRSEREYERQIRELKREKELAELARTKLKRSRQKALLAHDNRAKGVLRNQANSGWQQFLHVGRAVFKVGCVLFGILGRVFG